MICEVELKQLVFFMALPYWKNADTKSIMALTENVVSFVEGIDVLTGYFCYGLVHPSREYAMFWRSTEKGTIKRRQNPLDNWKAHEYEHVTLAQLGFGDYGQSMPFVKNVLDMKGLNSEQVKQASRMQFDPWTQFDNKTMKL
jgi:hypothetical protein